MKKRVPIVGLLALVGVGISGCGDGTRPCVAVTNEKTLQRFDVLLVRRDLKRKVIDLQTPGLEPGVSGTGIAGIPQQDTREWPNCSSDPLMARPMGIDFTP